MNRAATLAFLGGIFASLGPNSAFARGRTNPKFFGHFVGVSAARAAQGASFEESTVGFSLSATALTFGIGRDRAGRAWKIRYGGEWFMEMPAPERNCVRVAQDLRAHDSAYVLCFELGPDGEAVAAIMTKAGEPSPMRYVRVWEKTHAGAEALAELHASLHRPPTLLGLNEAHDLARGLEPVTEKLRLLRRLRTDFPKYDDERRLRFEPVVAAGLESDDVELKLAALEVFASTPSPTSLIYVLEASANSRRTPAVADAVIRTLGWYLHQMNAREAMRDTVAAAFGSDDIDGVWAKTGGVVSAKDMKALGDLLELDRPRSRCWTEAQRARVRTRLRELAALSPDARERRSASRVLRAWEPNLACAMSLSRIVERGRLAPADADGD